MPEEATGPVKTLDPVTLDLTGNKVGDAGAAARAAAIAKALERAS